MGVRGRPGRLAGRAPGRGSRVCKGWKLERMNQAQGPEAWVSEARNRTSSRYARPRLRAVVRSLDFSWSATEKPEKDFKQGRKVIQYPHLLKSSSLWVINLLKYNLSSEKFTYWKCSAQYILTMWRSLFKQHPDQETEHYCKSRTSPDVPSHSCIHPWLMQKMAPGSLRVMRIKFSGVYEMVVKHSNSQKFI